MLGTLGAQESHSGGCWRSSSTPTTQSAATGGEDTCADDARGRGWPPAVQDAPGGGAARCSWCFPRQRPTYASTWSETCLLYCPSCLSPSPQRLVFSGGILASTVKLSPPARQVTVPAFLTLRDSRPWRLPDDGVVDVSETCVSSFSPENKEDHTSQVRPRALVFPSEMRHVPPVRRRAHVGWCVTATLAPLPGILHGSLRNPPN